MTKVKAQNARDGQFIVDGGYIRKQASEAVALFLTPVSGVFRAAVGTKLERREGKVPKTSEAA